MAPPPEADSSSDELQNVLSTVGALRRQRFRFLVFTDKSYSGRDLQDRSKTCSKIGGEASPDIGGNVRGLIWIYNGKLSEYICCECFLYGVKMILSEREQWLGLCAVALVMSTMALVHILTAGLQQHFINHIANKPPNSRARLKDRCLQDATQGLELASSNHIHKYHLQVYCICIQARAFD